MSCPDVSMFTLSLTFFGNTEVAEIDITLFFYQDILWLEIMMNNIMCMEMFECGCKLMNEFRATLNLQRRSLSI